MRAKTAYLLFKTFFITIMLAYFLGGFWFFTSNSKFNQEFLQNDTGRTFVIANGLNGVNPFF